MFDLADRAMFALVLLALLASYLWSMRTIMQHKKMSRRYKFFAIRDALIRLVAEGKLSEDSLVFRIFYRISNHFVTHLHDENLRGVVEQLKKTRAEGFDPTEEKAWQKIQRELKDSDPDVRTTVNSLYEAIMKILLENSSFLQCVLFVRETVRRKRRSGPVGRHLPDTQREAYEFYEDYAEASERLQVYC